MLFTITTTHQPATDLGYLLFKHPERVQSFDLSFGEAHVFYPEASEARCTAALMLDIDPIGLVRGRGATLSQYVNDRPYVASSYLSVAIAQVFGTALSGRSRERPALAETAIPLEARIHMVPCRVVPCRRDALIRRLFEPLGYDVEIEVCPEDGLDAEHPSWGESPYRDVTLRADVRLTDLLSHVYVLIPVLDADKHYYIDQDEVEKLMRHGEGWLVDHPARELITRRYLKRVRSLVGASLARLQALDPDEALDDSRDAIEDAAAGGESIENDQERPGARSVPDAAAQDTAATGSLRVDGDRTSAGRVTSPTGGRGRERGAVAPPEQETDARPLNVQRYEYVLERLIDARARQVLDLGCGSGKLLARLLDEPLFQRIVGLDVSSQALSRARKRLRFDRMRAERRERIELLHGSLLYRDPRLRGFDAAAVVEVIEHFDPHRLRAFERVVFGHARPSRVVVTTPNREYNVVYELDDGELRHRDHRFEWTRAELRDWAVRIAETWGYAASYGGIGQRDDTHGTPTQAVVFDELTSP